MVDVRYFPKADPRLILTKGAAHDPKRTRTRYIARHDSVLLSAVSDQNADVSPAEDWFWLIPKCYSRP